MASAFGVLIGLSHIDANRWMISEVFARLRSGAALPGLCEAIRSYRPDLVVRETAEFAARWQRRYTICRTPGSQSV